MPNFLMLLARFLSRIFFSQQVSKVEVLVLLAIEIKIYPLFYGNPHNFLTESYSCHLIATYVVKVLRGELCNPGVAGALALNVPDRFVWRRRRPPLLAEPAARTKLLKDAPLTRAIRIINKVALKSDIFTCSLNDFTKATMFVLCYNK
jgi:hypothetical protein